RASVIGVASHHHTAAIAPRETSRSAKNFAQVATAIRLTKEFPRTISALVVGNEVLLRGEMTTQDLIAIIRSVKAQVTVPV
ncbi:hypothetical protein P8631_22550, partial [Guyparkeria sp. 1SP6A2]|nr:hypothetical protein [Guyparkeria sp. 1SP6A2]